MDASAHTHYSSYREMLLEHLFAGEVMRHLWLEGYARLEVLKPQVDDSGYDLVLEANGVTRHVQLKSSHHGAATPQVKVHVELSRKPSGCVVWIRFDPVRMGLGPFLWFGADPGEQLPAIEQYPVATHTKRNAQGVKTERQNLRVLPKRAFEELATVGDVVARLFGVFESSTPPDVDAETASSDVPA